MTFPSANSLSVTAGSIHSVSQQGWSLSSNKPLSHRLMPTDDKSPPPERVEPTVCLIKPKGRDRAGHTARERGRQRQIEEEKKPSFFHLSSSQAAIGLQDMTASLDLMPLFLMFLLSSHLFSFSPGDEKMLASLFLSLCLSFYFFLQTPTPLSMKTTTNLHN